MSTTPPAPPSMEQIKSAMRATWMAGDFGVIAKTMTSVGEDFAARLRIHAGSHVLDVATGTGNVAIPLAKSGCIVTGVDIAPNLLAQARDLAVSAGVEATFEEGDAEALPYADGSFDAVVTMFGAMFAPRPQVVAAELLRVLKPGGLLAMANWNPEGFTGVMFRAGTKYAPPAPGLTPPVQWGVPDIVRERLAGFEAIETEIVDVVFDMPHDPAATVELFRTYFGPTKTTFDRIDQASQDALRADLLALWTGGNRAPHPEKQTLVDSSYLKVTARKP